MLALRSTAAYSFQMDWSLDPKEDEVKKAPEDENENQSLNPQETPPLRRQHRNGQSSNGFHSQPSTEQPIVRIRKQGAKKSKSPLSVAKVKEEAKKSIENHCEQIQNGVQSQEQPPSVAKPTANELPSTTAPILQSSPSQQYDVANISNILKTFQCNRFINSSILKPEIKEEPPGAKELSQESRHNEENSHPNNCSSVNDSVRTDIKNEVDPSLTTVKTEVDIEAELPCTSIKQRATTKKRPARPRKGGGARTKALENPTKPTKECAKRTSKRKTNYCEDSSSDDGIRAVKSKTIIKTVPSTMPPKLFPQVDVKQEVPDVKVEPAVKIETKKLKDVSAVTKKEEGGEQKQHIKKEPNLKNKRVRNSAASSRNKNRLNPLTRKEQLMMNKFIESKEPFLQNLPCVKLASRISKCRECRCASLRSDSVFCRFFDFRRLRYKENAILVVDGFSDPHTDPGSSEVALWMPGPPPRDIDLDVSRFMLMNVADQFCRIWQEEQDALKENISSEKRIAWKKVVKGVREICDVCETTLFNFHWTCSKCGFGVCIDCYRDRKRKVTKKIDKPQRGYDDYGWLVCTFRESHEQTALMLTQIIPGDCLNILAMRLHEVCRIWKIPQKCGCPLLKGLKDESLLPKYFEIANKNIKESYLRFYSNECEIKYRDRIKNLDPQNLDDHMEIMEAETELMEEAKAAGMLPVVLATTLKHLKRAPTVATLSSKDTIEEVRDVVTTEYNAVQTGQQKVQRYMAQKVMTLKLSRHLYPGIDHDWLCSGKLLRLLDARNKRNARLFQDVWRRGQPVMVSELCKFLNISLWHPEAFCRDFGEKKNDLINCMTGNLVPNQPMKHFWEGFQCVSKRLLDSEGKPMLLKLKDWPPGDDFAEILPTRFADLMSALPMPEYTLRSGCLNIASRLPSIFVPPDLGPKMYNAYGSALHPDKGTTNLHLDISDAVNVMVYVGIPNDESAKAQINAALRAIDGGGCDVVTRRRAREPGVMPGALWHIYSARDADKIRDLLNRVTIERGYRLEPDHDPIHDQNWYLDNELRERLYDDYGVEGFPIVQCLGDAVFIPAGAPHQVRNLHNCIKVAEDFVSPENIQHCYHLSQQFRKLSMSHTNHEDKLQIRNIIYHAIKDTTSYLTYLLSRHM